MGSGRTSVIGAVARGVAAGAAGTLAMDLVWYRRYRQEGGTSAFLDWELSEGLVGYDDAPAPAQVAQRVAGVLGVDLPPEAAAAANNVVHWSTGAGWGAFHSVVMAATRLPGPALAAVLGPAAWATSYLTLGLAGIYKPIWEYDARTLRRDLTAHLAFGLTTAAAARLLGSGARARSPRHPRAAVSRL